MKAVSQCLGWVRYSSVHVIHRDRQFRDIVEQVVKQDLRGQNRQEGEEQRLKSGAAAAALCVFIYLPGRHPVDHLHHHALLRFG